MTYEHGSFFNTQSYSFAVSYRITSDPESFNSAPNYLLKTANGFQPTSSPYVVWTPYGGANGTIIVSSGTSGSIFVNQALGQGEWREIATPEPASYSRSLRILDGNPQFLMISGGGVLQGQDNKVTVSMMDLKEVL